MTLPYALRKSGKIRKFIRTIHVLAEAGKNTNSVMEGIRVEAMKSHALAEQIKVETMGLPDS